MYILDTDHLSILDRGGISAEPLINHLSRVNPDQIWATIISYEEQMRGWLSYLGKVKTIKDQILAYKQLKKQLSNYCAIPILDFDQPAAQTYQRLKQLYPKLGTMDLKIAAISLVHQATLLTRNSSDFCQISGLNREDWTV